MSFRLKLFWISSLFSNIALGIYMVTFSWLTVKNYGALGVSLVTFGFAAPQILLVLFGGLASDSINKQALYRICIFLFFIGGAWLTVTSLSMTPPLWLLVALSIANGSISAFSYPAQMSLVSAAATPSEIEKIQQIFFLAPGLGWVFGPLSAGHILQIKYFIVDNSYGALSFLIYTIFFIPLFLFTPKVADSLAGQANNSEAKSKALLVLVDIKQFLVYLRTTTDIRTLMRMLAILMILGTPFISLLSVFAHDHPTSHHSSEIFSRLYAAVGIGRLLASMLDVYFAEYSKQKASFIVYFIFAFCLAGIAALVTSGYWNIAICIILIGLFSSVGTNLLKGMIQSQTEPDMRGRVAAFSQLLTGIGSLSAGAAGYLIHFLSSRGMAPYDAFEYVLIGMFTLLALLTLANLPSIRRLNINI